MYEDPWLRRHFDKFEQEQHHLKWVWLAVKLLLADERKSAFARPVWFSCELWLLPPDGVELRHTEPVHQGRRYHAFTLLHGK